MVQPGTDDCFARTNYVEVKLSEEFLSACQPFTVSWPIENGGGKVMGMLPDADIWMAGETIASEMEVKMKARPDRNAIMSVWGDGCVEYNTISIPLNADLVHSGSPEAPSLYLSVQGTTYVWLNSPRPQHRRLCRVSRKLAEDEVTRPKL